MTAQSWHLPYLILNEAPQTRELAQKLRPNEVSSADARFQFQPTTTTVTTAKGTTGDHLAVGAADNLYMYATSSDSGLDISFTFNNVRLWSANAIRVFYDGFASSASLTYEIQIRDYVNSTWRNINPHEATNTNTADSTLAGSLSSVAANLPGGGVIDIYDGYFSNGSNTPVATPLSNFVNSDKQMQIRFYYAGSTENLQLAIDNITIQPSQLPYYYPSSSTKNSTGAQTNEYNDLTTDDATTSMTFAGAVGGISNDFYFTNVSLPYSDANTFLIEYSGHISTSNYSIAIYDYNDAEYQTLNGAVLTNTSDATNYFALVPAANSDAMEDFIDEANNNRMNIRVTSPTTSGTQTIDFLKLVIGSTHTNTGDYIAAITRGTTSSGTEANVRNLDTSNTISQWVLNATTSEQDTESSGDCTTITGYCVAMQVTVPVTVSAQNIVQSVIQYGRFNTNNADSDPLMAVRDVAGSYDATTSSTNMTAAAMVIRETNNPMPQQVGYAALAAVPAFTPNSYVRKSYNSMSMRIYTPAAAAARTMSVDFAFMTITLVTPLEREVYRKVPSGGTITAGTETNSNYRFTQGDDAVNWDLNPNGTTGTDVYVSFNDTTIPTGSNKLIITSNHRWDVNSASYEMYIYDFVTDTWRDMSPHETNFTHDATAANYDYIQLEIFDGYFSNGSGTPVSTPLSNFVENGEVRVRMLSASTTADLDWDFAQIQFVIDPSYLPADIVTTTGTEANEYTDLFTDDNTTNLTLTPSGNAVDSYLTFANVVMPPEGFNALFVEFTGWKTTSGTINLNLRNFTTGSWEPIKTGASIVARATHYYVVEIGDWSNYIDSNNHMRVQITSAASATVVNLDFIQITMGMVPKADTPVTANYGAIMNGTAASLGNIDTISSTDELNGANYLTITESNATTGIPAHDTMGGKSLQVDFPFHVDPGTYPVGLIWNYRAASHTTVVVTPTIETGGFNYQSLNTSFLYTLLAANAMAATSDTAVLTSTTQAFRQGWFVEPLANLWDSVDNRLKFRLATTTGLVNAEWDLSVDFVFLSYRWVPFEITPNPEQQMRGGTFFFGGDEQKKSF